MPACPPTDVDLRLYEDALLELARATRAFGAAIVRAAELGSAMPEEASEPLAERILDECRAALLPALAKAPGMLQVLIQRA